MASSNNSFVRVVSIIVLAMVAIWAVLIIGDLMRYWGFGAALTVLGLVFLVMYLARRRQTRA